MILRRFCDEAGFEPHAVDLPGNGADDTPLQRGQPIDLYLGTSPF
jgi:hypothetical protein